MAINYQPKVCCCSLLQRTSEHPRVLLTHLQTFSSRSQPVLRSPAQCMTRDDRTFKLQPHPCVLPVGHDGLSEGMGRKAENKNHLFPGKRTCVVSVHPVSLLHSPFSAVIHCSSPHACCFHCAVIVYVVSMLFFHAGERTYGYSRTTAPS